MAVAMVEPPLTGSSDQPHVMPRNSCIYGRLELPEVVGTVDVKLLGLQNWSEQSFREHLPSSTETTAGGGVHAGLYHRYGGGGRR